MSTKPADVPADLCDSCQAKEDCYLLRLLRESGNEEPVSSCTEHQPSQPAATGEVNG